MKVTPQWAHIVARPGFVLIGGIPLLNHSGKHTAKRMRPWNVPEGSYHRLAGVREVSEESKQAMVGSDSVAASVAVPLPGQEPRV